MPRWLKWVLAVLGVIIGLLLLAAGVAAAIPIPADELPAPADYGAGASSVQPSYSGLQRAFPPANEPADNPTSPARVELGRLLFFDPVLSAGNDLSCASCHQPDLGFSNGQAVPVGAAGPLKRNAPGLWNVAFAGHLFWDGRESSLEGQARTVITAPEEMGSDAPALEAELKAIPEYVNLFGAAFGGGEEAVSLENAARALAAFERTLLSQNSPFDQYAAGNFAALTAAQRRGLTLFRSAATRCFECHAAPTFSNDTFRVIGLPGDDPGRAGVAADAPVGAFKVPSLRNVALSAPYMHDGRFRTLEEVIDFYADGGGRPFGVADVDPFVQGFELTEQEKTDLIAFLFALTDESALPPAPASVPSALPVVGPAPNPARQQVQQVNAVTAGGEQTGPQRPPMTLRVPAGGSIQATVDQAQPGDTVVVPYGTYHERVVIDYSDFTLLGEANAAGEWPVLDGGGELADGVIASGNNFEMAFFTLSHYTGNGVLVEGVKGVYLHDLTVVDTGTYGVYPARSSDVLVERVTASEIFDAGIYAGKCENVVIRDSVAFGNVLGIEVENTVGAEVYGNHTYDNATGIFIDLLPNLPSKVSLDTRVYNNLVENNNHENFAPPEIIASLVPSGAGIAILGADRVEVYGNTIRNNNSAGVGIFNLYIAFQADEIDVGPNPENNWVHDNEFAGNGSAPDKLIHDQGIPGADILWDVSAGGNRFDQPGASSFPPALPGSGWPTALERIYWHGLNLLIKLLG